MFTKKRLRLRYATEPEGGEGGAPAPVVTPTAPVVTPAAPPVPVPTPPVTPASAKTFSEDYVKELREEATARRVAAANATKAAEEAAKERDAVKSELLTLKTAGVLKDAISAAGASAIAAAAIRGDNVLKDLDPASDDYPAKVKAAVEKYVTDHPELKAVPGTTRSAVPLAGGSGEGSHRPTSIRDALNRASS